MAARASTCAICGHDFVAAERAAQRAQAELHEEAAQRPVRTIAIGLTGVVVLLLVAALVIRNRAEAIAALTPTPTPTPSVTPTPSRTPTATATPPFTPTPLPPQEYTVQPGDSFFYIASIYQISVEDLLAYNGLSENSLLRVGQTILIPPPTPTPTPSPVPLNPVLSPTPMQVVHIVQEGETLIGIAQRYGVTVDSILDANNIQDPNQIHVGQQLVISQTAPSTATPGTSTPTPVATYRPVLLLHPLDGSRIPGDARPVLLQWLSSGILHDDETYRVTVEQIDGALRLPPTYIKATGLHLSPELLPGPDDPHRTFRWTVTIMRQVGVGRDGAPLYEVISEPSSRRFTWLPAVPTPTLTPVPNP